MKILLFMVIAIIAISACFAKKKKVKDQVSRNLNGFERCKDIKIKHLHIDKKVCIFISYLSVEVGFEVKVTLDGKTVFSTKISAKEPPALCFNLPIAKGAKACLQLTDVSFKPHHHGACLSLSLKFMAFKKTYKLGCIYRASKTGAELKGGWYEARLDANAKISGSRGIEDEPAGKCVCPKPRRCMCCSTILKNTTRVCGRVLCSKKGMRFWLDLFVDNNKNFRAITPVARLFTMVCGDAVVNKINSSICLQLSKMEQASQQLSGCVTAHIIIKTVHLNQALGCFSLKHQKLSNKDGLLKFTPINNMLSSLESV